MKVLGISRMPTKSECEQVTGNKALTNAISKRFGWYKLADDLFVDNCVKIDVLDDNDKVVGVMIVTSVFIIKTTQISTGVNSKYNIYTNRFAYIKGLSDYWKERGKNESELY